MKYLLFLLALCGTSRTHTLLYGNSFIERLQEHGEFEAALQLAQPDKKLRLRSLAWTGDQVGYRLRPERYTTHLKRLLDKWPADTVILGFGLYESFGDLPRFRSDLSTYLDEMARRHPDARIIVLSPIATEDLDHPHYPDPTLRNSQIAEFASAMREIATARGAQYIDLFSLTKQAYADSATPLTSNGIHLNDAGYHLVAQHLAGALSTWASADLTRIADVAKACARKARHVADVVRPVNSVLYFGVRGRPKEYQAEIPRFHSLIEDADAQIHAMIADPTLTFDTAPITLEPLLNQKPADLPTPAEIAAQMKVAPGYALNLFASEEQFPELRSPEQIAFDARGRLWVVTMPSFPGTIPGDVPSDKILILEDTDRDGKADTSTVFADNLTVPDGIAFYQDGVIISHQPRLIFMRDTDGDGRADEQRELLRGIDVTDAHHGGMIAMSPLGHIMFCDGVFHRSQLETPHGVTRGIDATTYRFDPVRGQISREYQTLTPNPWKIVWDRWGNLFQMYGDGFVQDGNAMPGTPFGVYHPFKRGISIAYGKGSAVEVVSSPNFPDDYQQGIASGVCVRAAIVSISKHQPDSGYYKGSDRLDILKSPNQQFRPVDIAFGLDGAMYVSDFCSRIIGHAQNSMRDPRWDGYHGRIWRVTHTAKPIVTDWPDIEAADTPGLLKLLAHPQDLVRFHARRHLRIIPNVVDTIDSWLPGASEQAALEALRILHAHDQVRPKVLQRLRSSQHFKIRAASVNLVRFQAQALPALDILQSMTQDPHPRVRALIIHTASHLQASDPAFAALLGQVNADTKDLQTILGDASHGATTGKGPEIPVLEIPKAAKLNHWLLSEAGKPERPFDFSQKGGSLGTLRTAFRCPSSRPAILSIRHSYVKVSLNGIPVISSANWWSAENNVQVQLVEGLNEIRTEFVAGRRKSAFAPVYLFSPTGQAFTDLETAASANSATQLVRAYESAHGFSENAIRITAVPNQLAFSPRELRVSTGREYQLTFANPDHQLHNLVIVAPKADTTIGGLADQM
ncbi:MAG: glucose/arabinose dehydrogenase, partial [Rhodothermales bacterium]